MTMTREEAIRIIETVFQDEYVYKYYDSITHQALNMAIEALQEPKTIIGIDIPYGSDKGIATLFKGKDDKLILEEVKELMRSWIPCSEKLPEKEELVLVTVWNDVVIAWRNRYGGWESVEDMYEKGDVIAWMPLPKPYKGGEEE